MSFVTSGRSELFADAQTDDWAVSETAQTLSAGVTGDAFDPSMSWIEQRERLLAYIQQQFRNASEPTVLSHLRRNSDLAWVLIGAKAALQGVFGDSVAISLSLVLDPESEEPVPYLFAYILTARPLNDALSALDRFDQDWLLDRVANLDGRLGFDLSF